ncbi:MULTISPECIES: TIGR02300 family protein [Devosia]|jgi:uncharacterized protein (TIGR02300 family)|uniref:TIGR02300 family protein n=1 Tax=Devosia litorisediminis TaxID=2829817 RepID=A0A942ECV5_9HYPH|nr:MULTISPECIES: TIGR02300 family protein [Devosia]MBS3849600.1 TIGR02300 family protein [Devosia litorisediminis]MCZ4347880.1 TIGR02300 family protein [Devosia neptuniae]|tara:strand:+ start:1260 stop:1658 length:399 start_codon:yes stop_codon:yes gene_type:complete
MASSDRGTKRTDPETGKKFYDLNLDPIVSPYTGKSYPRSFFEQAPVTAKAAPVKAKPVVAEEEEDEVEDVAAPVIVSLEEADAEESGDEDIPDTDDVEVDEELGEDDADTFLEDDEDDDDDIGFDVNDDEET